MLEIEQFVLQFPTGKTLKAEDLTLSQENILALCGPSGSGKTMLAKALLGITPPGIVLEKQSQIRFQGNNLRELDSSQLREFRWRATAWIDQDPNVFFNPVLTLKEHVLDKTESLDFFFEVLSYLGLHKDVIDCYPHELSGGMKQRAMIAYCLVHSPSLIIADEPSTALDKESKQDLLVLLKKVQKRFGGFLIFITHEIDLAWQIADNIILFEEGRLHLDDKTQQSSVKPLRDKFFREYEKLITGQQILDFSDPEKSLETLKVYQSPVLAKKGSLDKDREDLEYYFLCSQSSLGLKPGVFSSRKKILDSMTVKIALHKITMIIGASGAGKSSFLQSFIHPSRLSGYYRFPFGTKRVSMLFQNPAMSLNSQLSIYENLIDARDHFQETLEQKQLTLVEHLISMGFVSSDLQKYPHAFSGGQLQRLALIRALLYEPEVLLLDEPTSSLDVRSQNELIELLVSLQQRKQLTYIWVTHEKALLRRFADTILVVQDRSCEEYVLEGA